MNYLLVGVLPWRSSCRVKLMESSSGLDPPWGRLTWASLALREQKALTTQKKEMHQQVFQEPNIKLSCNAVTHLFFLLIVFIISRFSSITRRELTGCLESSNNPLLGSHRLLARDRRKAWKKKAYIYLFNLAGKKMSVFNKKCTKEPFKLS